jgi:hypothetical protein
MKTLILRPEPRAGDRKPKGPYAQEFCSSYAERVIGNLIGDEGFCASCGPDCNACRKPYHRGFRRNIAGIITLPGVLPYLLERPADYVPDDVPPHDVILAINVHEQILLEFLNRCRRWGTRGVVVPLESPDWVSGSARALAQATCSQNGVEVAFPKPFCVFDPPAGTVLAEFRRRFCIGKPEVELAVQKGKIRKAHVHVSAACGATYYVARWLTESSIDDDLKYEIIAKRLHSYPCTASMKWDDEIGDTIMHLASQAHYEILTPLTGEVPHEPDMVVSPLGRMVQKPVATRENVKNIEHAKEAILRDLACQGTTCLRDLRKKRKITPAAVNSALLLLKQSGKIRTEGDKIFKA